MALYSSCEVVVTFTVTKINTFPKGAPVLCSLFVLQTTLLAEAGWRTLTKPFHSQYLQANVMATPDYMGRVPQHYLAPAVSHFAVGRLQETGHSDLFLVEFRIHQGCI